MGATSSEVKNRWKKANYKLYQVNFRNDTDKDLIDFIEAQKQKSGTTELFREAMEDLMQKYKAK